MSVCGDLGEWRQAVVERQEDLFHNWMKCSFIGTIPGTEYACSEHLLNEEMSDFIRLTTID